MISLLRCPEVSIDLISKYLSYSNKEKKFSNFGYCETMLRKRFSKILDFPLNQLSLGSSATSLLKISCDLFSKDVNEKKGKFYFPAFSFFSTFSISASLPNEIEFYDMKDENFLPYIPRNIQSGDLLYLNAPFGSSKKLSIFINFAKTLPCPVIIDAAACLPGIINYNFKFSNLPPNVIIIFSLHATKLISCGEGGLCLFGKNIAHYFQKLTNFGINSDRKQEWLNSTNAKMSEFNAAAGLSSLDMAEENISKVFKAKTEAYEICKNYGLEIFDKIFEPTLTLNFWSNENDDLVKNLKTNNYEYRRWWSLAPNLENEKYQNSIEFYNSIIGVPFDWADIDSYFEKMCSLIIK